MEQKKNIIIIGGVGHGRSNLAEEIIKESATDRGIVIVDAEDKEEELMKQFVERFSNPEPLIVPSLFVPPKTRAEKRAEKRKNKFNKK